MKKYEFKWLWWLFILTHVGYAAVAVYCDPFLRKDPMHGDAAHFDQVAWSLASGGSFDLEIHRAPLFPLIAAGVYSVIGHHPEVIRVLNGLFMVGGAWFLLAAARRRFSDRFCWWFLLALSLHPLLIYITGWLYTEALMVALVGATFWAYDRARENRYDWRWVALVGVLLGLVALTRSIGILYAGLLALWMAYDAPKSRRLAIVPLVLATVFVVISPWTYRQYNRYGELVPVSFGGKSLFMANNESADGRALEDQFFRNGILDGKVVRVSDAIRGKSVTEANDIYQQMAVEWIKTHPDRLALVPSKLYYTFTPISYSRVTEEEMPPPRTLRLIGDIGHTLFLLVVAVGLRRAWKQSWREVAPLWLMAVVLIVTAIIFNGTSRYTVPMVPFLCFYFVAAWVSVGRKETYKGVENDPRGENDQLKVASQVP